MKRFILTGEGLVDDNRIENDDKYGNCNDLDTILSGFP